MAKKTKFLSILMSAAIASSMIPATAGAEENGFKGYADEIPDNWTVAYNAPNTGRSAWNKEQDYVGISKEAHNGRAGVAINIQSPDERNRNIVLSQEGDFTPGTYTISFWFKGTADKDFKVTFGTEAVDFSAFEKGDTADGWTKYSKEVSLSESAMALKLEFSAFGTNAVIDNVSVVNSDGDETLENGDFEAYSTNVEFKVNNIDTAVTADNWTSLYIGTKDNLNYAQSYAAPIAKYAYEGERGMYITYPEERVDNTQLFLMQNLYRDFEASSTWVLEFYAKTASTDDSIRYGFFKNPTNCYGSTSFTNSDYTYNLDGSGEDVGGGWKKYTKEITFNIKVPVKSQNYAYDNFWYMFGFAADNKASAMIDNVVLYEKSDANKTNIIKNGDFETVTNMAVADGSYTNSDWSTKEFLYAENYKRSILDSRMANFLMFAEPTAREAKSGSYSLRMSYPLDRHMVTRYFSDNWMRLSGYNTTDFEAGTYTVSAWVKGLKSDEKAIRMTLGGSYWDGHYLTAVADTLTEDGWQKYSGEITIKNASNMLGFAIQDRLDEVFVDDITVEKDGVNYLDEKVGGFEKTTGSAPETKLLSAVAYPLQWRDTRINVAWKNPNNKNISKIKVYVDGKEYKNNVPNVSANAYNEMFIDVGVQNIKAVHDVQIVATIAGKDYTTDLKSYTCTSNKYLNNWQWDHTEGYSTGNENTGVLNFGNAVISADREVKNGGNASLKVSACLPQELNFVFPSLKTNVTLDVDKYYAFFVDIKTETDGPVRVKLQENNFAGGTFKEGEEEKNFISSKDSEYDSDWKTYTFMLDTKPKENHGKRTEYDETLYISIIQLVGDMWIDNAAIYEVDNDGDPVAGAVNLLGDGNMEFAEYKVEDAVFKLGDEVIDHTVPGKIDVSTKINNYAKGDDFNVAVFTAVYDGKELVSVEKMQKNIAEKPEYLTGETFSKEITVDNANQTVKVMYWNGKDLITPIAPAAVLSPLTAN